MDDLAAYAPHTLMVHIRGARDWTDANATARRAIADYTRNIHLSARETLNGHMNNAVFDLIQNPTTGLWHGTCTVTV